MTARNISADFLTCPNKPLKTIKIGLFAVFAITLTNSAFGQKVAVNGADAILKSWQVPEITVQFYKSQNTYSGKIIHGLAILEADGKTYRNDSHNPDPELRSQSLKDYTHITGLKYKNGKWVDGKVYDFDSGKSYDLDMELKNNILHMRVFMGVRMLGKTFQWKPVK